MSSPSLLVLAAGMGSRYGSLKQLDPVGPTGEILLDYSVYDACRAGFAEVVFVIRRELEESFHEVIGRRYEKAFSDLAIRYVFQESDDLPRGFSRISERVKPWGTGQALLAARHVIKGPFAVINADDYYGANGYRLLADFLSTAQAGQYAMIGYQLEKTLSDHGTVSRGICQLLPNGLLKEIIERTAIRRAKEGLLAEVATTGTEEKTFLPLTGKEWVSLNFWGFTPDIFPKIEKQFGRFLQSDGMSQHPLLTEFYLPAAVSALLENGEATVQLLPGRDSWFGLTYPQDRSEVMSTLAGMVKEGHYPSPLI